MPPLPLPASPPPESKNHKGSVDAIRGDAEAQWKLGQVYFRSGNWSKAKYYLNMAALQGHREAQCDLALCFIQEGKQDLAVQLLTLASRQQSARALFNLGMCHWKGDGVVLDTKKAVSYFQFAATTGMPEAQAMLAECLFAGSGGLEKNDTLAFQWILAAASQGLARAQVTTGMCCLQGQGTEPDPVTAVRWFAAAALQGDVQGESNLGYCYYHGLGVKKDETKAYRLWSCVSKKQGYGMKNKILTGKTNGKQNPRKQHGM